MKCPNCESKKSIVTNTRDDDSKIIRYRKCIQCNNKFKTIEIIKDAWSEGHYKEMYEKLRGEIYAIYSTK